jgi:hypothetical protein
MAVAMAAVMVEAMGAAVTGGEDEEAIIEREQWAWRW